MSRVLRSRFVDRALRGAALVVTDRRWAAPLSAAALGLGVFAGVAIGPGAAGTLATGAQQIIEIPSSGRGDEGQSGGGGATASAESAAPLETGGGGGGFEEALPSAAPLASAPVEPLPTAAPTPAPERAPAGGEAEEEEESESQRLEGTVVHVNPAAGSYAVAIEGGELVSIHAPELPDPGTELSVPTRRLANGAFVEAGDLEEEKQAAKKATFRGAVTYANPDPADPVYTVSGRGSSLLVRAQPDPGGAAPELPAIGAYVTVTARFEEAGEPKAAPELVESKREVEPGPPSTYLDLAGVVSEVTPEGRILLSADDAGESEADLTLTVPKSIDATKLEQGDSYLATATVEEDGSLKLAGIASDEHTKGADDPSSAQGDLKR